MTIPAGARMTKLYVIFFISGFPALIYQIVWQRALFTIYGVNVESITVVVTAFMTGLGLGSLIGGMVSRSSRIPLLVAFAVIEVSIGAFGYFSLSVFERVGSLTLSATAIATFIASFFLVLFPTVLMGATLPLLVAHLVQRSGNVGRSVGILYFANTLGSAVACFVAPLWLLGALGMQASVSVGCVMNLLVAACAFAFLPADRRGFESLDVIWITKNGGENSGEGAVVRVTIGMPLALLLAGLCGYIALSYELVWMRVYSFLTGGLAATFRSEERRVGKECRLAWWT